MFEKILAGIGITGIILFFLFCFSLGGICLHYDIHYWASYTQHRDVQVSWFGCILGGFIPLVSQFAIIGAVITFICSFFM